MQLIRQCPVNLRPVMGVRPQDSSKGQGYMAHGYLTLYRATQQAQYLREGEALPGVARHNIRCHASTITAGAIILILFPVVVRTPTTIQLLSGRV